MSLEIIKLESLLSNTIIPLTSVINNNIVYETKLIQAAADLSPVILRIADNSIIGLELI